jgi:hypothetical protein
MGYTVEKIEGCTIVRGSGSIMEMVAITQSGQDGDVIDPGLAKIYEASLVCGSPAALKALRTSQHTLALARAKAEREAAANSTIPNAAKRWLEQGERGLSSETMFTRFTGIELDGNRDAPADGDDFRRCRLLLDQVPEFQAKLHLMKDVSKEWHGLVDSWQELCDVMDDEAPDWRKREGTSRRLNAKMQEFLQ